MIRDNPYEKLRAVFLAALMVVSVFGGTIAFAGSAAAATDTVTLHDEVEGDQIDYVKDGGTVYVKVTDGNTVGGNSDVRLTLPGGGTQQVTVYDDGSHDDPTAEDGVYWGSFTVGTGGQDVVISSGESVTVEGTSLDSTTGVEGSATVTADFNSPSFDMETESPTAGNEISEDQPTISVDLSDTTSGVVDSWTEVKVVTGPDANPGNGGDIVYHKLNATTATGVSLSGGTLSINVAETAIGSLSDDTQYTVYAKAYDQVNNTATTTWSFTVDTNPVTATIDQKPDVDEFNTVTTDTPRDVQVTVNTDLTDATITSASVTIESDDGSYSETVSKGDDAWTPNNGLSFGTAGADAFSPLPDGDYTISLSATDGAGNTETDSATFSVDTNAPSVENVEISDGNNDGDNILNDQEATTANVTITFNESVQAYSGQFIFGNGPGNVYDFTEVDVDRPEDDTNPVAGTVQNDNNQAVVTFRADLSNLGNGPYDNASARINVTDAEDIHGNGDIADLKPAATESSNSERTFGIDTETPSAETYTGSDNVDDFPTTLSGVVDFRNAFVYSGTEGTEVTYTVQPGQEGDWSDLSTLGTVNDFATSGLPEGTHNLGLTVRDDAGNTVHANYTVTVDNTPVSFSYAGSEPVTGTVDLVSGSFDLNHNGTEDVQNFYYKVFGTEADADDEVIGENDDPSAAGSVTGYTEIATNADGEYTVNVNDQGDGYYVFAIAVQEDADSATEYITTDGVHGETLNADDFSITADGVGMADDVDATTDSLDREVLVNVSAPEGLSTLNVKVSSDNYDTYVSELDLDDLTWNAEQGVYQTTFTAPRDGQFTFMVKNATLDQQSVKDINGNHGPAGQSMNVDAGTPELLHADVVAGDGDSMTVDLQFNESISGTDIFADEDTFQGASITVDGGASNADKGLVTVTLGDEVQTGGDTEIDTNAVTEKYNADNAADNAIEADNGATSAADSDATSVDVTYLLKLEEGINTVSIPAETGTIPLENIADQVSQDEIEGLLTYEDGDWISAAASEDFTHLYGGQGYVVNANSVVELHLNVDNVEADGKDPSVEHLENGWNLVGAYQLGSQDTKQAVSTLPDSADWSVSGTPAQLQDGNGYWLFTNDEQSVYAPVSYDGLQSARPVVANVGMLDNAGDAVGVNGNGLIVDGEEVTVTADVQSDAILTSVTATVEQLGITNLELTHEEGTTYTATTTVNYQTTSEGQTYTIDVTATDTKNNVGYGSGQSLAVDYKPNVDINVKEDANGNIDVVVTSSEELATLSVTGSGELPTGPHSLSGGQFEEAQTGSGYTYTFDNAVVGAGDALFTATVTTATDMDGHSGVTDPAQSDTVSTRTTGDNLNAGTFSAYDGYTVKSIEAGATPDNLQVGFQVSGLTTDGNTDTFLVEFPETQVSGTETSILGSVNSADVETTGGQNIAITSSAYLVDRDGDGTDDAVAFAVSPDGGNGPISANAYVDVSLDSNYKAAGSIYDIGAQFSPSGGDLATSDSAAHIYVDESGSAFTLDSATTVSTADDNDIEAIDVTFASGVPDPQSLDAADFKIGNSYTISGFSNQYDGDSTVRLDLSAAPAGTGVTPNVAIVGEVTDLSDGINVTDGATPVTAGDGATMTVTGTSATFTNGAGGDTITLTFSEAPASGLTTGDFSVTFAGGTSTGLDSIQVNGQDVTLTLTKDATSGDSYTVTESGSTTVTDGAGNSWAGTSEGSATGTTA